MAEAYGKTEPIEEGLRVLAAAFDFVDKTGECVYEAELYRLKGELTLQSQASLRQVQDKSQASQSKSEDLSIHAETEAEACFLKAIETARRRQAKSLELRATVSLARLWQQQGKKKQARKMLAEISGWFTEGFDPRDLQEARVLLQAVS